MTGRAGICVALAVATGGCGPQSWFFDADGSTHDAAVEGVDGGEDSASGSSDGPTSPDADADAAGTTPDGSGDGSDLDASPACAADSDCPSTAPLCDVSRGVCVRCGADFNCADAAAGPACEPSSGRCVACTSDLLCNSQAPRCDPTTYACVRCLSSADCGRESTCDLTSHTCMQMF